jgi:hypothetical protein
MNKPQFSTFYGQGPLMQTQNNDSVGGMSGNSIGSIGGMQYGQF